MRKLNGVQNGISAVAVLISQHGNIQRIYMHVLVIVSPVDFWMEKFASTPLNLLNKSRCDGTIIINGSPPQETTGRQTQPVH